VVVLRIAFVLAATSAEYDAMRMFAHRCATPLRCMCASMVGCDEMRWRV
jgi:hypothetical protein